MRDVYIVLLGPSVLELKRYEGLIPKEAIICGVNDCFQDRLLHRDFNYIHFSADEDVFYDKSRVLIEYCNKSGCQVVTSRDKKERFFNIDNVIVSEFSTGNSHFCEHKYNSLTALMLFLMSIGHKKFFIFGADGRGGKMDSSYRLDSDVMNKYFWKEVERAGFSGISVVNVNHDSEIKCFDIKTYSEFFQ